VRGDPQRADKPATAESVETSPAEALFDTKRREALALLGFDGEAPTVLGGGRMESMADLFERLLALADEAVLAVLAVVMGETLHAGSPAVDAVASEIGVDMAQYWQADDVFFDLLRDREVLVAMVEDVAGARVAEANAKEKGKTLKGIIEAHLAGADGREKVEGWVPRWMAFPPSAYTERGGVGAVAAYERASAARAEWDEVRAATEAELADSQEPAIVSAGTEVLPQLAG
jgi:ParB family chromosome partitioning protein